MQKVIKYFYPGKRIVLFDKNFGLQPKGELIFTKENPQSNPTSNPFDKIDSDNLLLKLLINYLKTIHSITWKFFDLAKKSQQNINFGKLPINFNFSKVIVTFSKINSLKIPKVQINFLKKPVYLNILAFGFLSLSITGFLYLVIPIVAADINVKKINPNIKTIKDLYSNNFVLDDGKSVGSKQFRLIIPKINIESPIIPNVDASNEQKYKSELKNGVVHAAGSYLPNEKGAVFLFAHSTNTISNIEQFNAKFYALKDLVLGDEIQIIFDNKRYFYKVSEVKIINPNELDQIRSTTYPLVLSTCWPPGTSWQRLIVFASITSALAI